MVAILHSSYSLQNLISSPFYLSYFSEGQNFIGLISTADLGRWQLGLTAFRPTVNISHGTTDPKRFSYESSLDFVSIIDMACERK